MRQQNPHGLKLDLFVDPDRSIVTTEFIPQDHHAGFDQITHGGAVAAVLDEAMTWAATWWGRRFCFCGELTVRFRKPIVPGRRYLVEAVVEFSRPKLIETTAKLLGPSGAPAATASGKYLPMSIEEHRRFTSTMIQATHTPASAFPLGVKTVKTSACLTRSSEQSTHAKNSRLISSRLSSHSQCQHQA
jgi:acyl-coenzyme A thioesterase PaaI-like protein